MFDLFATYKFNAKKRKKNLLQRLRQKITKQKTRYQNTLDTTNYFGKCITKKKNFFFFVVLFGKKIEN